uniref:Uncharacterized protein n=1 Tax=Rhizophora mucronata TaxID=61149 RepID=A0A2P2N2C8_RHIMU
MLFLSFVVFWPGYIVLFDFISLLSIFARKSCLFAYISPLKNMGWLEVWEKHFWDERKAFSFSGLMGR